MNKTLKPYALAFNIVFALSLCVQFIQSAVSPDKDLELYNAKEWLDGHGLYQGIFGVQPPLIYALYTVPAWLSKHLGLLQDHRYLALLGFLAVAYVVTLALRLIHLHPQFAPDPEKRQLFVMLLLSAFVVFQSPTYFVDREYLMLLLTFPYVLRFSPSLASASLPSSLSIAVGLLACVGSGFKPQCLLIMGGVNLYYLLHERSLAILISRENITFYLAFAFYLLLICLGTPEYITIVMPMAMAAYGACNNSSLESVNFFVSNFLPLAASLADFRRHYDSPYRRDILYFLTITFWYFIYAMTNFGWGYSWNPLFAFGMIVVGFLLWEYRFLKQDHEAKGLPVKPFVFGIRACTMAFAYAFSCGLCYIIMTVVSFSPSYCATILDCDSGKEFMNNIDLADNHRPYTSFWTVDVEFNDFWMPFARKTNATWLTHYNLWMLPAFFLSDAAFADKQQWIMQYAGNAFAQDMRNKKPGLVFVADSDKFYRYPHYVDLIAYMNSFSPGVGQEWKHYRFVGRVDRPEGMSGDATPYHGYYVYQRKQDQ